MNAIRPLAAFAVLATSAGGGCAEGNPPPSALSNGSPARPPPVELEGVDGPIIATGVRLVRAGEAEPGSATATCAGNKGPPGGVSVERVDIRGESVTYLGSRSAVVQGCDAVGGARSSSSWCGRAFGRLEGGRVRDPRLSLECKNSDNEVVGFAWIQPLAGAEYVVVAHSGYNEAYPVAAGVPVRIAGEDVDVAASRATFAVSEHDRDGRRLRSYELEAAVSG